jgi:predicted O-linked N-acetylglucosamine transferase (SPINDLY family)
VSVPALLQQAFQHHQRQELKQARELCERILRIDARHTGTLQLLASILAQTGDAKGGIRLLERAAAADPRDARTWCFLGAVHQQLGQNTEALSCYDRAIALDTGYADAHLQRGGILMALDQPAAAVQSLTSYLSLRPRDAAGHAQLGAAGARLGLWNDALASYDRAIALNPGIADAFCNRGNVLQELGRWGEALASYDQAIHLRPDLSQAHYNRGNLLRQVKKPEAAIAAFDRALEERPNYVLALIGRAGTLLELSRFESAIDDYMRVQALDADSEFLPGALRFARMQICDWVGLETEVAQLSAAIEQGMRVAPPFPLLALVDAPALHRKAAAIWSQHRSRGLVPFPAPPVTSGGDKIRIAYFSPDLHEHPVARQLVGLIEAHDRSRFEVAVFSLGPDLQHPLRERIRAAADRFIDVRRRSDREVSRLARELGTDIAIDLGGYSQGSRPGIFMLRAAPVQMSYIGYLGTQGDFIDYMIADPILVPVEHREHYAEKILYLPCYQVNDPMRPLAARPPSRQSMGIPPQAFVYCCYNSLYKITPVGFAAWMRILARVPDSVLVLQAGPQSAMDNLCRQAELLGIDSRRLLFQPRLAIPDYLARMRAADLFLDTWPYNAGTTASDALWAGLPVLTCPGKSFASRFGASLLHAVGLQELVTGSMQSYEDLAVALAAHPEPLAGMRARLEAGRATATLFDAPRFARHFEAACRRACQQHHAGQAPDHILVNPDNC